MRIVGSSKRRVNHYFTIEPTTPGSEDGGHVLPLNPLYTNFPGNEQPYPSSTSLTQTYNSPTQPEKASGKGEVSLKTKIQLLSTRIAPPQEASKPHRTVVGVVCCVRRVAVCVCCLLVSSVRLPLLRSFPSRVARSSTLISLVPFHPPSLV